ncbi:hypothetical protein Hanom_Chr13g01224721 [Helianthus anomalus]
MRSYFTVFRYVKGAESTSKSLTLNHHYKVKEHRKWGCVVLETKWSNHLSLTLIIHDTLRIR